MAHSTRRYNLSPLIFAVAALVIIPFFAPFLAAEPNESDAALSTLFVISPVVVLIGGLIDGWYNSYGWIYAAVIAVGTAISALVFYNASALITVPYYLLFAVLGTLLAAFTRSQMRPR